MWWLLACSPLGPWNNGGDDSGVAALRLELSPALVDFGQVSSSRGIPTERSFTLYNLGESPIKITGHDEPLGDPGFYVEAVAVIELGPGEEEELPVFFLPAADRLFVAELLVRPGEQILRLEADGLAPVLEAGPAEVGATVVGCASPGLVEIRNTGREKLQISAVQSLSTELEITGFPPEVGPGATAAIDLFFVPERTGNRTAFLQISSNDPQNPTSSTTIEALGYEGSRIQENFRYYPTERTDILVLSEGASAQGPDTSAFYLDQLRMDNVDYQLTALSGGSPCPIGSPPYATRSDTALQGSAVMNRAFRQAAGPWDSQLPDLALLALGETGSGGCLEGFRRDDATLEILLVADGPGEEPAPDLLAQLELLAPKGLRISGLLPQSCGSIPAWEELVGQTGGTLEDSCSLDWEAAFQRLGELPNAQQPVAYPLDQLPVPSSITVMVGGSPWTAWHWESATNEVVMDSAPALGSSVVIEYISQVECSR
jgi:hypothetical protein